MTDCKSRQWPGALRKRGLSRLVSKPLSDVYQTPLLSSSQDVLLRNFKEVICTVFEAHRRHLRIKEAEQEIDTGGATKVTVPRL
jgi:hypothetical protein